MSPQQYISTENVKQTVEKLVKQKPTIAELTTIEKPGKPVPQELEEETPPKKIRRRKTPKSDNVEDITEKEYILIITEKPQAAQKIAQALGTPRKYQEGKASYFEVERKGEKIVVANAVGHLFNLNYKEGQKGYPIFELEWRPSYEKSAGAFTRIYLTLLKKLAKKARQFIIATDYDIEGEVIGWNVLRFACNQKTAKRMKYSTLTKPELIESYENPLPELDWGQAYAGETRHILDWLYGINLSRALMAAIKTSGSFKILSIGRVQGPALKIIVDREHEIAGFKSEPFWRVFAKVDKTRYKHPKDIFDKRELEKFKDIKEAIAETKETEEKIQPPHPFDLTTLQRESYRLHGISPSQTLQIAQKLYLNGYISYPRTSSQKIPEAINPKKILKALTKTFPKEIKLATRKKPIEGKKSDPAHPSIYPTGEIRKLEDREEKLYNLIAKRFISAFSPDAVTSNKRTILTASPSSSGRAKSLTSVSKSTSEKSKVELGGDKSSGGDKPITFTASGLKVLDKGWTQIYPTKLEESEIPTLNGKVNIDKIEFEEKETQPPKRYSPASLITILEKKNLGTKATRSMIVDTLFDRGYLDGKSIKATPLGIQLIETLEKYSSIIIDENLTRDMEEEMENIQNSKSNLEDKEKRVIEKAEKIITDISKEFKSKEIEIGKELLKGVETHRKEEQENNTLMPCQKCKKGNLRIIYSKKTRKQFVACDAYPECKETYSLPPNALIKNTGKKNEGGLPILVAIRKGKRPWEFPFNPNWKEEQNKEN